MGLAASVMTQNLESITKVHGIVSTGDVAKSGADWGARIGGFFGLVTGVASFIVPGRRTGTGRRACHRLETRHTRGRGGGAGLGVSSEE